MYKKLSSILICLLLIATGVLNQIATEGESSPKSTTTLTTGSDYKTYIANKSSAPENASITIDATKYASVSGTLPEIGEYDQRKALATYDDSTVEWTFNVESTGLYDVCVEYYPLEGRGSSIDRILYVDGKIPFKEAENISFSRSWKNDGKKIYTASGNEYRRTQIENNCWMKSFLQSSSGYEDSNLKIYLIKGEHSLKFESVSEPVAISEIHLFVQDKIRSYEEISKTYSEYQKAPADTFLQMEGEDAELKSSPTLYAVEDRTSPENSPYDESKILLNSIGSSNWKYKGEWLEWEVDVPDSGLYSLSMRTKQDFISGANAARRLFIDGEIPFKEAENIEISYNLKWQMITLGGNSPYQFYMKKGKHSIRLEAVIGSLSSTLDKATNTIRNMNTIYRKVVMITGSFPDSLRDYNLEDNIPDLYSSVKTCLNDLEQISGELERIAGIKGEQTVSIEQIIVQLKSFLANPDSIPERMPEFSDNINALAAWVVSAGEVPLTIDYLVLAPVDTKLPPANSGLFKQVWSSLKGFILSFFVDYYSIESFTNTGSVKGEVSLWLAGNSGRDQATIVKNLADNYFTRDSSISLNLHLVDMDVLLRAVSSGNGPDVAIFQSQAQPLNYGMRGAIYDLNQFTDVEDICKRFSSSAVEPFRMNEKLFALPEQQVFPMMFYRTDILDELGITSPDTWDDLYKLIPILQEKSMEIGLTSPVNVQSGNDATSINGVLAALLLQNGGKVYDDHSRFCTLDSLTAVNSFIKWSEFYTKYNFPKSYSEINRFRTGTMPILITSYTFYNTLSLAAPEIQGQWAMAPIPGMLSGDGTIHREAASSVSSCMIFNSCDNPDNSWEFLKWWTSTKTQIQYGREIEALQGPSARWPTANLEAMKQIGWSKSTSEIIQNQWKYVEGIPEVPGGYYVGRSVDNAIKSVVNMGKNARESLLEAVGDINEEILNKRQEFGLE